VEREQKTFTPLLHISHCFEVICILVAAVAMRKKKEEEEVKRLHPYG
jgi:hypothetical protein